MAFDLGQPVPLAVNVTDATGVAANATTVVLTVTLPDGTSVTPTVTNGTTGSYTATYVPTQPGRYSVYWVASGTNASAYSDEFNVNPAGMPLILSLADVKAHLRITTGASDARLRRIVGAVTDVIESRIGPVVRRQIVNEYVDLIGRTVYNELTTAGTRQIVLRKRPVISLDAISSAIASNVVYTPTDFLIEPATGIIRRIDNGTVFGPLNVTYTVGMAYVPPAVEEAALIIVQHMWETARGAMGQPGLAGDDVSTAPGYGFSVPNRALELLEPYLTVPAVG